MRKKLSRRAALSCLAALAPVAATGTQAVLPAAIDHDPVFAAIEAYRMAVTEVADALERESDKTITEHEWQALLDDASDQEAAMLLALLETMPTTPHGLSSVLAFMGTCPSGWDPDITPDMIHYAKSLGGIGPQAGCCHPELGAPAQSYLSRLSAAVLGMAPAAA